jgi:Tfp pilus assembly protein PilN
VTPDFSTRAQRRRLPPLDAALLGVAILAGAWSLVTAWRAWDAERRAEARLAETRLATQDDQRRLQELTGRRKSGYEALSERAALTFAAPPARVLADLEQAIPAGARLDGVTLHYGQTLDVEVTVVARAPASYDRFLERFEATRRFSDLTFGTEDRSGEMKVTVHGRYRSEEER